MSGAGRYSCISVRQFAHIEIKGSSGRTVRVAFNCDGLNTCAEKSAEDFPLTASRRCTPVAGGGSSHGELVRLRQRHHQSPFRMALPAQ